MTTLVKQNVLIGEDTVMAKDFLTAEFRRKRAKLSKLGKKLHKKKGATDQPHYNGFRVIRVRVITVFQCSLQIF